MRSPLRLAMPVSVLLLGALPGAAAGCDDVPDDPTGLYLSELVPEVGPPGELVLVRGGGFGQDSALVRVTVGGLEAPVAADLHSDTAVAFTVPADQPAGTWPVVVAVEGIVSNELLFRVEPEP